MDSGRRPTYRTAARALLAAALLAVASVAASASQPSDQSGRRDQTLVVPAASSTLPATWHQVFAVGYGKKRSLLGTAPGGDSGTLRIGPEYGAPGPDEKINPYAVSLDPSRWEADGLFDGSGMSLTEARQTPAAGVESLYMEAIAQPV